MKKALLALAILLPVSLASAHEFEPYVGLQGGILASNGSQSPVFGVRGGVESPVWDFSGGYWIARGVRSDNLLSDGLNLHVVSAEVYRTVFDNQKIKAKVGGGIGYTVPNLDGGATETADNGMSWVLGGGADYALTESLSVGASLKAFIFSADTHATTYDSHPETLSNGQDVEIVDVNRHDNRVNFNSVLFAVALRWK